MLITGDDTQTLEPSEKQKKRVGRAMEAMSAKALESSEKEDPVFEAPLKLLCHEADTNYSTMTDIGFQWHFNKQTGVKYVNNAGKFKIKARTFLRARGKLDRIEKIAENAEKHIFSEGGVSAD